MSPLGKRALGRKLGRVQLGLVGPPARFMLQGGCGAWSFDVSSSIFWVRLQYYLLECDDWNKCWHLFGCCVNSHDVLLLHISFSLLGQTISIFLSLPPNPTTSRAYLPITRKKECKNESSNDNNHYYHKYQSDEPITT